MRLILLPILLLTVTVAACSPESEEAPATPQAASAPAAAPATTPAPQQRAAIEPSTTGPVQVVPASLDSCAGTVTTVKWDFSTTAPDASVIEIFVGGGADATLFASGGNVGEAPTQAWTMPGSVFVARDKASGRELGRAVVGGPACQAAG